MNFSCKYAIFKIYATRKKDKALVIISALIEEFTNKDIGKNASKANSHFWKGIIFIAKTITTNQVKRVNNLLKYNKNNGFTCKIRRKKILNAWGRYETGV